MVDGPVFGPVDSYSGARDSSENRVGAGLSWVERDPAHVVARWLGHSPKVAAQHSLMRKDRHFQDVVGGGGECRPAGRARGARRVRREMGVGHGCPGVTPAARGSPRQDARGE